MSFDINKIVFYWESHAEYDIETAKHMFKTKRYPYVLFMCHLSVEKLLKGIYVKENGKHSIYTHNLVELAKKTKIDFFDEQKKLLAELSGFNIEARYPEWKSNFYKIATKEFTEKYYIQTKKFYLWLKKYLKK